MASIFSLLLGKNSHFIAQKVRTHLVQFYCNFVDGISAFRAICGFEPARGTVLAPKQVLLLQKIDRFQKVAIFIIKA